MEEKDSEISGPCEEFRIWFCGEVPSGSVAWYCIDVSETTESSTKKLNPFSVSNHFPSDYYAFLEGCIYSLGGQGSDETLLNDVWILDIKSLDGFAARGEEKPKEPEKRQEWLLACGEAQMAAKPYGPDSIPYCKPQEPEKAWLFEKPRLLLARDPDEERLLAAQLEGLRRNAEQQERRNAEQQERLKETMRRLAQQERLKELRLLPIQEREEMHLEQQESPWQTRLRFYESLKEMHPKQKELRQQESQEMHPKQMHLEQQESLKELRQQESQEMHPKQMHLLPQESEKERPLLARDPEKKRLLLPRKSFSKMPERRGWRSSIKPGVKVVKHFREHWEEEDWKPDSGSGETWKPNYVVPPWIRGPPITFARCNPHTMVVDQKLYVLGGFEPNQSQAAGWIEVFDPVVGEWEVLPSPPDQIHSSVMISGLLKAKGEIIIAKQRRDRHPMLFYSYNILTRCWNTLVPHESNVIVHLPPNAGRAVTVGNTLYWISTEEHNHECIIRAYDLDRNMWFKDHLNTATIFGRREHFSSIYSSRPGFLHLRDQKFCLLLQSSITKDYPESSIKYLYCVTLDISPIYEHEDRGKFELTIVSFQKYSMDRYINFLDCMLEDRVSGVKSVDRRGQSTSSNISFQEMVERPNEADEQV